MTNGSFDLGHVVWLSWEQKNFFGRFQFQCLRNSVKNLEEHSEGLGRFGKFGESTSI
jgi:hypothetical protein